MDTDAVETRSADIIDPDARGDGEHIAKLFYHAAKADLARKLAFHIGGGHAGYVVGHHKGEQHDNRHADDVKIRSDSRDKRGGEGFECVFIHRF